ncbi:MAG: hypothetical protein MUF73_07575 [Rhodobacteraceae bacterium]|jgi:hypothetical protein|nr:hypothetical protein [Paracoccaceae bacterium]
MPRLTIIAAAAAIALTGCMPSPSEPDSITLLGGYRDPADACRRVGETAYTNQFLDDAADLVGCPEGAENLGVFVTETGAREVDRFGGYILYSVPLR